MPTNKLVLKSADQFMADFKPIYNPIFPMFVGGNSQQYSERVGVINFKRLEAVGDIRAKHITPKDTDIRQVIAVEKSKTLKKYFLANQYVQSDLQDPEGIDQINAQVLDENNKLADDLLFLGEGTSASTMINNGLFWSNDPNYVLDSSEQIDNAPDTQNMFYDKLMADLQSARDVPGRKLIMIYGSTALSKLDSLFPEQVRAVREVLQGSFQGDENLVRVPSQVGLGSVNGWIMVNMDQIKLHYTVMPKLDDQGVNSEKKYTWHNFILGSMMVEVLASGAIRRQPVTFEA